ncbi:protein CLN8 [Patella vulgata]|uniref:protein CLN8 n=1 Tax=Patella vulgata TaxID=6465 RepID=UPI0021803650|nr:protein CLN8 [Patella vulgata]
MIHPKLVQLDYESSEVKKQLILGSFFFFFGTYIFSMIVSPVIFSSYKNLKTKEKVFWHLAIVRSVFGIFAGLVGLWALSTPTNLDRDVVFGTTATTYFAIATTVGFFTFECTALLISDIIFRNYSMLLNLHHWLSLVGYSIVLFSGSSHFFAGKGLVLEMSTPFSAICWTMLKCGKEKSFLWKANQFFLVHTFHCRSIVECYLLFTSYKNWDYIYTQMPSPVFYALYIQLPLITFVMTPYWTYKKTVQMVQQKDWNFEDSEKGVGNGSIKKDA